MEQTTMDFGTPTLSDMDALIKELRMKRDEYDVAKKAAEAKHGEVKNLEAKVIQTLEDAGKTTYIAEGVGKVTVSYDMSVQTPKTIDEKRAFFEWVKNNLGQEVHDSYMTVNSISLNSLYKQLNEEYCNRGEILQISGLGEPVARTKLSLRKV